LMGKVIFWIAKIAQRTSTKVAVIAGQVTVSEGEYKKYGIVTAVPCKKDDISLDYALKNSETLLLDAAKEYAVNYLN